MKTYTHRQKEFTEGGLPASKLQTIDDLVEGEVYSDLPVSVLRRLIRSRACRGCWIGFDESLNQFFDNRLLPVTKDAMFRYVLKGMTDEFAPEGWTYSARRSGRELVVWGDMRL